MKISLLLMVFISMVMVSNANAAFIGPFAYSNWTQLSDGGLIETSADENSLILTSSNDDSGDEKNQDYIISIIENVDISFNWDFQTTDPSAYDPFGVLVNGVFTQLSDNLKDQNQSGIYNLKLDAGDIFGFRSNSIDSSGGSSVTTISNFTAIPSPVPLPPALWLMIMPLFSIWRMQRCKV